MLLLLVVGARAQDGAPGPNPPVDGEEASRAISASTSGARGRSFYVTMDNYQAPEALSACAEGYHMASLWEIFDVSRLVYAADHGDARVQDDSGAGVPANWYGWIRTGGDNSVANLAGTANCDAWTSAETTHRGTIARLSSIWDSAPTAISPWDASVWACSGRAPVWCVED